MGRGDMVFGPIYSPLAKLDRNHGKTASWGANIGVLLEAEISFSGIGSIVLRPLLCQENN
jgi:hypothetical protein